MKRAFLFLIIATVVFLINSTFPNKVQTAPPENFQTTQIIGSGLDSPSGFGFAPDGRIFILQRAGKVMIYKNGTLLANPFVDLPSEASGDRGLIGIEFDPDFANNHYVYFYYTSSSDLLNRLVRFDASDDVATSAGTIIFTTSSPSFQLHVGGNLAFGPDGKLYFAVGDNGVPDNAQDLSNPHGKILRINKDGTIPTDNPFYGQAGKYGAIWANGFRNPWRFNFDSSDGRLYAGDVGEATWEEINLVQKGANYGWPVVEGPCTSTCPYTQPIYYYNHNLESAAVTLGPVYRANMFPSQYQGKLFFGDYAQSFIKTLGLDANGNSTGVSDFDTSAGSVVDFKVAPDGSLYYITYIPGRLYRISYSQTNHTPIANTSADIKTGNAPLTVHFSSFGTSDPDNDPITYSWDFGDNTKSTDPNPTKTYENNGTYTVELTVSDGVNSAQAIPIIITVGIPPTISIGTPQDGTKYKAGDTLSYMASAVGGNGLELPSSAISTDIIFHHQTDTHPFLDNLIGNSGAFTIPMTGEDSAETWFEIKISATDSSNLTSTKSVNVYPYTSNFTLNTNPPGLQLFLDSTQINTPTVTTGVVNFQRELKAPLIQNTSGKNYQFRDWSDGGAIKHIISTPPTDTVYTANFQEMPAFNGQYFNNMTLSGTPTVTRIDNAIDFDWDGGSPDPAIDADHFSARWIKNQYFAAGNYQFTASSDDGVRLFIDGNLVIDKWIDQANTAYSTTVTLNSGDHAIKLEYYENGGQAAAKLAWDIVYDTTPQLGNYQAQYFNNMTLSGTPTVTRNESDINFDWGSGSPDSAISPDNFSARFTKTDTFEDGTYEFTLTADDGARLYVDNILILDKWIDQPATTYKVSKALSGAQHDIRLEYYENGGGATVALSYTKTGITPPTETYQGSYWNAGTGSTPQMPNTAPNLVRADADINFDWGTGSPDVTINPDHFVVRWIKDTDFEAANYRFTTTADDGIRLYIDNNLVIDKWLDQGSTTYTYDREMTAGPHNLKIEYYENGGGGAAKFNFAKLTPANLPNGLTGEYFNNIDFTTKTLTRIDQTINFDWGTGSPDPLIDADTFSVRWTGQIQTNFTEPYVFTASTDDGVRVWVNDTLIIDKWVDQGETPSSGIINLTAGQKYNIKMEYYENGGGAAAKLFWSSPSTPKQIIPATALFPNTGSSSSSSYTGSYWNTPNQNSGPFIPTVLPNLVRADADINFDWGTGSPDVTINPDHFVVRWIKDTDFEAANYRFTTTADDGIRLYIDNNLVIDKWLDQGSTTYTYDREMTAGPHNLKIEYYENGGGAVAKFNFAKVDTANSFTGQYFDNQTLTGNPILTRNDAEINFIWGDGSPDPSIPVDHFSARWIKQQDFAEGSYSFTLNSDDGIRFWIDNQLIVDDWNDHAAKTSTATVNVSAGIHTIKIEYYENAGGALSQFAQN